MLFGVMEKMQKMVFLAKNGKKNTCQKMQKIVVKKIVCFNLDLIRMINNLLIDKMYKLCIKMNNRDTIILLLYTHWINITYNSFLQDEFILFHCIYHCQILLN